MVYNKFSGINVYVIDNPSNYAALVHGVDVTLRYAIPIKVIPP